jgi:hypothetical protein
VVTLSTSCFKLGQTPFELSKSSSCVSRYSQGSTKSIADTDKGEWVTAAELRHGETLSRRQLKSTETSPANQNCMRDHGQAHTEGKE